MSKSCIPLLTQLTQHLALNLYIFLCGFYQIRKIKIQKYIYKHMHNYLSFWAWVRETIIP